MKTVYTLYTWTTPGGTAKPNPPTFTTLDQARAAAGYPNSADWRTTPAGGWGLHDHMKQELGFQYGQPYHISEDQQAETDAERIELAIALGFEYGGIDGDHHKRWTIDQMIRILAGDRYAALVADYRSGEDGPDTYSWDEGVAP